MSASCLNLVETVMRRGDDLIGLESGDVHLGTARPKRV
jgi:hypothetical protein